MSKYVNIKVSANLSTDFYLEVSDNATNEQIQKLAKKEIILPTNYPNVIDKILKESGITVRRLDSILKSWNIDEIKYIIDNENKES